MRKIYSAGSVFKSKYGESCRIVEELGGKSLIEFLEGEPHTKIVHNCQLRTGEYTSNFRKKVYGTGIFVPWGGYDCRKDGVITKAYGLWANMLKRVYCPQQLAAEPSYTGTTVCADWHRSDTYWMWAEKQVGWLEEDYHQDKDILLYGNKQYNPDTVVFIPQKLNTFLVDCRKVRSEYGQGVYKKGNRFKVCIWNNNKPISLGQYKNLEDATAKFAEAKTNIGLEWGRRLQAGEFEVDQRVIDRMLNYEWKPTKREDVYACSN